jgi:hypothetical protein
LAEIVSGAGYATFINTFRCQPSNQDEVVRINVEIVDRVASTFPGFIVAAVHHLATMQGSPEFQTIARQFAGLIEFEPHECEVVHVSGPD